MKVKVKCVCGRKIDVNPASLMASYRAKKLGTKRLKEIATKASRSRAVYKVIHRGT